MKKNVFSLGICLLLIACSPENELDPDPTSETRLITKTELVSDSILSLDSLDINLLSSSDYTFDKIYPEIGNLPAPSVHDTYTPDPQKYFSLQINNPLLTEGGGVSPALARHRGEIQIQWRLMYTSQWYNYHPQRRNWEELYTDTIYDEASHESYYPQKWQWIHTLNPKALPTGNLQFRVRLILEPTYDSNKPLDNATLWSQPSSGSDNSWGNDFYNTDREGREAYVTARIKANLAVRALNRRIPEMYAPDRIENATILYVKVLEKNLDYLHPYYYFTTSKNIVIKEPINFIYNAEIAVQYSTQIGNPIRTEYTNKRFVHPIYYDQSHFFNVDYTFYDEIEIR